MSVRWRGRNWSIRYYGPDGRQREEVIGPNRKEAETVLHQRLYEVRSGIFPILRRRSRITFADHTHEWMTKVATARLRASTKATYQWLLDDHLLPAFGARALTMITPEMIHAYAADELERLAPKTVNHGLPLLREILEAAVEWGRIPSNPTRAVRRVAAPRREMRIWTVGEIRKFLLAADDRWRPLFTVALFTGLRVGEIQAMGWEGGNRPNFTTNKLEVSCSYSHRAKALGRPKTERSIRAVDMVPSVRSLLRSLPRTNAVIFPGVRGSVLSQPDISEAFHRTITRAELSRIRFHDCRHIFASLLIAAGKNVVYVANQMGHYSPAFTLSTYAHLMDRLPVRPVEWIDDLVFPEGLESALNLPLSGAPRGAVACSPVQSAESPKSLEIAVERSDVQSDATGFLVGRAGLEPATLGLRVPCTTSCANGPGEIVAKAKGGVNANGRCAPRQRDVESKRSRGRGGTRQTHQA